MAQGHHRHHTATIGGLRHRTRFIACRGDDHHAAGDDLVDRALIGRGARARAAETEVEDACRVRVRRDAADAEPGGPAHPGDDVGVVAAALAEHAHRQQPRPPGQAGESGGVVGERTDDPRHARTVPGAVLLRTFGGGLRRGDPIARIGRIGIAPIAVVRRLERVVAVAADEIVARQQTPRGARALEIGMIEPDACIEHRDDDTIAAGRVVAGARLPSGRRGGRRRLRRLQIPLRAEERIVGCEMSVAPSVGLGERDLGVGAQHGERGGERRFVLDALKRHDIHLRRDRHRLADAEPRARGERRSPFGIGGTGPPTEDHPTCDRGPARRLARHRVVLRRGRRGRRREAAQTEDQQEDRPDQGGGGRRGAHGSCRLTEGG